MAKQIKYGDEARKSLLAGIDAVSKAVTTALGPKGRNVALDKKWGAPNVIHDGVTVAKEIELEDPFENMGEQQFTILIDLGQFSLEFGNRKEIYENLTEIQIALILLYVSCAMEPLYFLRASRLRWLNIKHSTIARFCFRHRVAVKQVGV